MTSSSLTRGPEIPAEETWRRALLSDWIPEGVLSSAAFNYSKFSVELESRATRAETFSRLTKSVAVAEVNCGLARTIGYDARDESDPDYPENKAHAHVYRDVPSSKRKARARELADNCAVYWRETPPNDEPGILPGETLA